MQHLELATRGRADEPACSYSQWLECWKLRFQQGFSFINCILAYHLFSSNWVFLLSIAYLHITCSLGTWPMVHTTPTALVLYGTHLIIVSCIIVKNCPVIQKNVSSSFPWLHMTTQLATVRDFTSNVLQNCAELQKLREVHLPPVEFHRTQLRKVRDFTCSTLQNCEELKEFWKFASSSLWNSISPHSQM